MSDFDYIRKKLMPEEVLAQLAEEASELAQAALKLRRVITKTNPTPVTAEEATASLTEEFGDVLLCAKILCVPDDGKNYLKKLRRWADRLREAEHGGA